MILKTYEISRAWSELQHTTSKLCSTINILYNLGMARTFGEYRHSVWNGEFDYALYKWRGKHWAIPTSPVETEKWCKHD